MLLFHSVALASVRKWLLDGQINSTIETDFLGQVHGPSGRVAVVSGVRSGRDPDDERRVRQATAGQAEEVTP